jgi:DNA invertase Pin-like site-specific DNA recombinase
MSKKLNYIPDEICTQAVIFARVSSDKQEQQGVSLDVQMETITDYCAKKNLKVIKEFNISESSTKNERKQYNEMLDFVRASKKKTAIVVNFVDRLQRNPDDTGELNRLRKEGKIEIHFIKENLILHKDSSGMDLIFWNMYVLMAYSPVVNMVDKVKSSLNKNWNAGKWQGFAPIGYINIPRRSSKQSDIIIDTERAPKVKRLFDEYATGLHTLRSLEQLAKELNLTSLQAKNGKTIHRNHIYNILTNPFYYGVMRVKGKLMPHIYEPIIDKSLFDCVQDIMTGNSRPPLKLGIGEIPYMFRGLIRCGCCGGTITPETHTKKSGLKFTYLRCSHIKDVNCTQELVNEDVIMGQLNKEIFDNIYIKPEMLENIKKNVQEHIKQETIANITTKREINARLATLKAKEDKLFDFYLDGKCAQSVYDKKSSEIETERIELKAMTEKYDNMNCDIAEMTENIIEFAANVGNLLKSSCAETKREIFGLLLTNPILEGKKLRFSMLPPFDKLLKTRDCKTWLGLLGTS